MIAAPLQCDSASVPNGPHMYNTNSQKLSYRGTLGPVLRSTVFVLDVQSTQEEWQRTLHLYGAGSPGHPGQEGWQQKAPLKFVSPTCIPSLTRSHDLARTINCRYKCPVISGTQWWIHYPECCRHPGKLNCCILRGGQLVNFPGRRIEILDSGQLRGGEFTKRWLQVLTL